jgi:hypothetical protein
MPKKMILADRDLLDSIHRVIYRKKAPAFGAAPPGRWQPSPDGLRRSGNLLPSRVIVQLR